MSEKTAGYSALLGAVVNGIVLLVISSIYTQVGETKTELTKLQASGLVREINLTSATAVFERAMSDGRSDLIAHISSARENSISNFFISKIIEARISKIEDLLSEHLGLNKPTAIYPPITP